MSVDHRKTDSRTAKPTMSRLTTRVVHRALSSEKPQAILNVARVFHEQGDSKHANLLRDYAHAVAISNHRIGYGFGFGATFFGADVSSVQTRLNALGADPPLTVDGISGPKTDAAIRAFQQSRGLTVDGVVGPLTLAALGLTSGTSASKPTSIQPASSGGIIAVRGIENTSNAFRQKLVVVANNLGIEPNWLATVISFETAGKFLPDVKNGAGSGATGLIQFMPSTAAGMGTSTDELAAMSDVEQLDWVEKYLSTWKGRMHSLNDVYLAIFMPTQMGKSNDSVVASEGSKVYEQNIGFDPEVDGQRKGYFTVGDITGAIRGLYNAGVSRGTIPIEGIAQAATGAGIGAILAVVGIGLYYLLTRA
jgi:peptidoglycan hydrolase-like protein with peptidoglycan-binding domain